MKILTNFPYCPFSRSSGTGRRFLQNILGLRELGHNITILSQEIESPYKWTSKHLDTASMLGLSVKLIDKQQALSIGIQGSVDLIWATYYHSAELYATRGNIPIICDNHDLADQYEAHTSFLKKQIREVGRRKSFRKTLGTILDDQNTDISNDLDNGIYSPFNHIVTISKYEEQILQDRGCRATFIPFTPSWDTTIQQMEYSGLPVFCASSNLNNLLMHDILGEIVLPKVRLSCDDYELQVIGDISEICLQYPFVDYKGYIDEFKNISARYALSYPIWQTGQSIKLLDFQALGIPVSCGSRTGGDDRIIRGESGLIANSLEEFIENSIRMWRDPDLCRRLGANAFEIMKTVYTKDDHLKDLERVLTLTMSEVK